MGSIDRSPGSPGSRPTWAALPCQSSGHIVQAERKSGEKGPGGLGCGDPAMNDGLEMFRNC